MSAPKFEHSSLPGNVHLGINSNRKLKTIRVAAYFVSDLDERVTRRALIPMVLRRGSRKLPDLQAISRRQEELYGAGMSWSVSKVGEWQVVKFALDIVNEVFLPGAGPIVEQGLEFFRDLIFDPVEVGGGFHPDYVAQEKEVQRRNIESLVDDKGAYATFRCVEEMCREEPFRLNEQGRVEDIPSIDPTSLFGDYRGWVDGAPLHIYVAGDLDPARAEETLAAVFSKPRSGGLELKPRPAAVSVGSVREVRESMQVSQGKLVLGFRHGLTYGSDAYEALLLMNGVLGGSPVSKLFQNVREKASLAYSVSSWIERTKGLLFIAAGIAVERFDKALAIILEQVEHMKRGEFSQEELDTMVQMVLNHNRMLEDDYSALAEVDFVWGLHGRELDLEAFREKLVRVTRDDIVAAAQRLQHDTTYFLHG